MDSPAIPSYGITIRPVSVIPVGPTWATAHGVRWKTTIVEGKKWCWKWTFGGKTALEPRVLIAGLCSFGQCPTWHVLVPPSSLSKADSNGTNTVLSSFGRCWCVEGRQVGLMTLWLRRLVELCLPSSLLSFCVSKIPTLPLPSPTWFVWAWLSYAVRFLITSPSDLKFRRYILGAGVPR